MAGWWVVQSWVYRGSSPIPEWKVRKMDMLGFSKSREKRCGRRPVYVQIVFEQVIKLIPFICVSNGSGTRVTTEHSWGLLLRSSNSSRFLITHYGNTETGLLLSLGSVKGGRKGFLLKSCIRSGESS